MTTTTQTLGHRLADNYTTLRAAIQAAFEAAEETARAKADLKYAQQRIINQHAENPKELGGNEAARNARIDELTTQHREELARAEADERNARHALDLARLDLSATQAQVQILELAAKGVA